MENLKLKFTSGNDVPVTEARITRKEYERLRDERDKLQATIDCLMIRYCPDDMTNEQIEGWVKYQLSQ